MTRTFTFTECYELLNVDPKTFRRWLDKAGIDPEHQISKTDNRIRFLTEDQVKQLAAEHGRNLQPQAARTAEIIPANAYKLLLDRVENLEKRSRLDLERLEQHDNQFEAADNELELLRKRAAATDQQLSDHIDQTRQQLSNLAEQLAQVQKTAALAAAEAAAALDVTVAQIADITGQLDQARQQIAALQQPRPKAKASSAAKEASTAPAGEHITARKFAEAHSVTRRQISGWIDAGQIQTIKVPFGSKELDALTPPQQADTITWWDSEGIDYTHCPDCPHGATVEAAAPGGTDPLAG